MSTVAISRARRILYFEFPMADDPSTPAGLPRTVLERAHAAGARNAVIITSAPVHADRYRALTALLRQEGIAAYSDHIEALDIGGFTSMRNAADDLLASLRDSNTLLISYGRSHAPTVVACAYVAAGVDAPGAIDMAHCLRGGRRAPDEEGGYVYHFGDYLNLNRGGEEAWGSDTLREVTLDVLQAPALGEERLTPILDALPAARRLVRKETPGTDKAPAGKEALTPVPAPVVDGALTPAPAPTAQEALTPAETALSSADEGIPEVQAEEVPAPKRRKERRVKQVKPARPVSPAPLPANGAAHAAPFYRSLQFKLISIISIIIAVSLSGMIFVATYFFSRYNRIQVDEASVKLAEVLALKVSSDFESIIKRARLIDISAARPGADPADSPIRGDQDIMFASTAQRSPEGEGVRFDRQLSNDDLLARLQVTRPAIEAAAAANGKTLARSFTGELIIHNVSQSFSAPVMALCMPEERDPAGRVNSIMICFVSLANIQKAFETRGDVTQAFMVNDQGDIIAHPDVNIVVSGGNFIDLPIVKMMMTGNSVNGKTRYRDENGVFHIGSFQKTGIGACGVITTVEEQRALEEVYNIQRRNIYLMIIVLTVGVMVIFYFGKSITTPIVRLVDATKLIRDGNYQVDIRPTTRDEIGELTSSFIEMGRGLEEREKIKAAFGKFVNKEIAEAAMRGDLALGGERKNVAVLFSDIRRFTAISETLEPEEVVEFLNEYLSRMVGCVNGTHGVVDKFIGDAIMAIWGTPVSHGNDTVNALDCALMMRRELIEYNLTRGTDHKPIISIGCGINTGPVLAGQIGSQDRMEYTVIGDTVNLASRIEALNKPFGTDILVSQDAYEIVKDTYAVERMQKIRVKGKEEPQQIYAVLGRLDDPARPQSVLDLRALLSIKPYAGGQGHGTDEGEVKYEILE